MNDKTYNQTCKRITRVFYSLRDALGLGHIDWELKLLREGGGHSDDGVAMAEIHPSWSYGRATIRFYVEEFVESDEDLIADAIVHEFVHYWLNPISRYGSSKEYDQIEEHICTEVMRAIRNGIRAAGEQVADHWRMEVKRLEKEIKALKQKEHVA